MPSRSDREKQPRQERPLRIATSHGVEPLESKAAIRERERMVIEM